MCKEENERLIFDESVVLKDNAMLKHRKELFYQWNFEENDKLGLDVYRITQGTAKIAWWKCPNCKSPYDMPINKRTARNQNCPYCAGVKVNFTNSLNSLRPDLASEWHPVLNRKTPHDVTLGCNDKVWWLGAECGHEWVATINDRAKKKIGTGCPYCSNVKLLKGFNDMWSTNPDLARLLADAEDGYRYMQSANKKVNWKCPDCDNLIKNKAINNISTRELSCPRCSDDIPFGERFIYNLLKENRVEFEFDVAQDWSKGKRYDFYFEFKGAPFIIEVHGIQHYEQSRRGRSLKKEQENDRLKENLARENSITNYIVIDARESTVEWISNSIINSNIMNIIDHVDFENIGQLSSRSFIKVVCDLWLSGVQDSKKIAELIKLSQNTITTYLKRGAEIGWCDYQARKGYEYTKKGVVKLTVDDKKLSEYESISDAKRKNSYSTDSGIVRVCQGKTILYDGFKWMYKDDYELLLATGTVKKQYSPSTHKKEISVVKLSEKLELIECYDSVYQAAEENNMKSPSHISRACRESYRTAGGFKWMYKEEYDEYVLSQPKIKKEIS